MPKYGYLVVEGPHDVEFVYRLLSPFKLKRIQFQRDLDPFFNELVPTKFPHKDDIQKRVPVPLFLQSTTHAIAIQSAGGDSRIVETIEESSGILPDQSLTSIGMLLDSDETRSPADRYKAIRDRLRSLAFVFPDDPGVVASGLPRLGGFVLPDNVAQGTLEHVLLECARGVYPDLLHRATAHVDGAISDPSLDGDDKKELGKPAGRNKAIVASMGAVLRPGRAIQASIQDNRWLRGAMLDLPPVKAVQTFLVELFEIES